MRTMGFARVSQVRGRARHQGSSGFTLTRGLVVLSRRLWSVLVTLVRVRFSRLIRDSSILARCRTENPIPIPQSLER